MSEESIFSNFEESDDSAAVQTEEQTEVQTDDQTAVQTDDQTDPQTNEWLPEEFRNDASFSKFKDINSLPKSYKELQSHLGKKQTSVIPDENSSAEDWGNFYKSLGVPDKAEDYKFETDKELNLPETVYTEDIMKTYQDAFKEVNLTPKQAQELWNVRNQYLAKELKEEADRQLKMVTEAQNQLKKDWGDKFNSEMNKALQAFKYLVPDTDPEDYPLTRNIDFVRLLNRVHSLIGDDKVVKTQNPANTLASINAEINEILQNPDYKNASSQNHDFLVERMSQLHVEKAKLKG